MDKMQRFFRVKVGGT